MATEILSSAIRSDAVVVVQQPETIWPNLESFMKTFIRGRRSVEVREDAQKALVALQDPEADAVGALKTLLSTLAKSGQFIEAASWEELNAQLQNLEGNAFLGVLERYASRERTFTGKIRDIHEFAEALSRIPKKDDAVKACNECFRGTVACLDDAETVIQPLAPTRFSILTGEARLKWSRVDAVFSKVFNEPPHQYCGCHALADRVVLRCFPGLSKQLIPLTPPQMAKPLSGETVAIFGCEWGSGHKMPAQGVAELCRDRLGAHVFTFNLPDDVLPPSEDAVYNSPIKHLGFKNVTEFYNSLMRENAFAIINWTQKGNAVADPEGEARRVLYIMRRLLEVRPTFVVTTYSKHNEELIRACTLLGIPLLHVATDVKNYIVTRDAPPKTSHFAMAMPVEFEGAARLGKVKDEQLVISGPFVRTAFMKDRTPEDNVALRAKWKIPEGKKVIVFPDTGNGASLTFIEEIRSHFEESEEENPYHCIVLCKGDEDLEQRVKDLHLPYVEPLRYANADQMEELMTMAAYGGALVGKSGGATVYEALRRGTRLLVPNLPTPVFGSGAKHVLFGTLNKLAAFSGCATQLPWEVMNCDFMRDRAQAREFSSPDRFVQQLRALTHEQQAPVPFNDVHHFEDQIVALIPQMLRSAREDEHATAARTRIEEIV